MSQVVIQILDINLLLNSSEYMTCCVIKFIWHTKIFLYHDTSDKSITKYNTNLEEINSKVISMSQILDGTYDILTYKCITWMDFFSVTWYKWFERKPDLFERKLPCLSHIST